MRYNEQTRRRRFAYTTLIAYAFAALLAGVVPISTMGLFPDVSVISPASSSRC